MPECQNARGPECRPNPLTHDTTTVPWRWQRCNAGLGAAPLGMLYGTDREREETRPRRPSTHVRCYEGSSGVEEEPRAALHLSPNSAGNGGGKAVLTLRFRRPSHTSSNHSAPDPGHLVGRTGRSRQNLQRLPSRSFGESFRTRNAMRFGMPPRMQKHSFLFLAPHGFLTDKRH